MNDTRPDTISELAKEAGVYLEAKAELLKLKAADKTTEALSSIGSAVILVLLAIMILFALNIGLGLLVGEWVGITYVGFFIVAGFYLLIGLIVYAKRNTILKAPMYKNIINKIMK